MSNAGIFEKRTVNNIVLGRRYNNILQQITFDQALPGSRRRIQAKMSRKL